MKVQVEGTITVLEDALWKDKIVNFSVLELDPLQWFENQSLLYVEIFIHDFEEKRKLGVNFNANALSHGLISAVSSLSWNKALTRDKITGKLHKEKDEWKKACLLLEVDWCHENLSYISRLKLKSDFVLLNLFSTEKDFSSALNHFMVPVKALRQDSRTLSVTSFKIHEQSNSNGRKGGKNAPITFLKLPQEIWHGCICVFFSAMDIYKFSWTSKLAKVLVAGVVPHLLQKLSFEQTNLFSWMFEQEFCLSPPYLSRFKDLKDFKLLYETTSLEGNRHGFTSQQKGKLYPESNRIEKKYKIQGAWLPNSNASDIKISMLALVLRTRLVTIPCWSWTLAGSTEDFRNSVWFNLSVKERLDWLTYIFRVARIKLKELKQSKQIVNSIVEILSELHLSSQYLVSLDLNRILLIYRQEVMSKNPPPGVDMGKWRGMKNLLASKLNSLFDDVHIHLKTMHTQASTRSSQTTREAFSTHTSLFLMPESELFTTYRFYKGIVKDRSRFSVSELFIVNGPTKLVENEKYKEHPLLMLYSFEYLSKHPGTLRLIARTRWKRLCIFECDLLNKPTIRRGLNDIHASFRWIVGASSKINKRENIKVNEVRNVFSLISSCEKLSTLPIYSPVKEWYETLVTTEKWKNARISSIIILILRMEVLLCHIAYW